MRQVQKKETGFFFFHFYIYIFFITIHTVITWTDDFINPQAAMEDTHTTYFG